jgi:AraC-like DNA-binding protein
MESHSYALNMTSWPALLKELGIRPANVLRRAELPEDLFARASARLETARYFRFWEALEAEAGDAAFVLRLYGALRGESFSPPLFAALCSPNLLTALQRLSQYKALVAPIRLDIVEGRDVVTAKMRWLDATPRPPGSLVAAELLFFVCLARMGTHDTIRPSRVVAETPPDPAAAYEKFLGVAIHKGTGHSVSFSREDALKPFLSSNDGIWSIFEPALRKRLAELDASATIAERVRATLLEGLPSGKVAMDDVAQRLALSKRTLQRRLEGEGTSYHEVVRATREALAFHYLERTDLPLAEISFLLGFEEPNSFFRAFNEWTGRTPESVRREAAPGRAASHQVGSPS